MQNEIQALRDEVNRMKQQQEPQLRPTRENPAPEPIGLVVEAHSPLRSTRHEAPQHPQTRVSELSRLFLTQFISGKRSRNPNTQLFAVKQEPKESSKDYIARFNEEELLIEDYDDKMTLAAVFSGLKERKFTFSIGKNPPKTLVELVTRAQKYTNTKEFSNARKSVQVAEPNGKGKRPKNEESQQSNKRPDDRTPRDRHPNRRPEGKFRSYTLLDTSTEQILLDIRGEKLMNWPICKRDDPDHRDKRKYCRFHRDHGHNTADCVDLKDEIETLVRKGHLR
ncbi:uncharacterized protein LOC131250688 [Magnolia sinica]|uniref:uncharacterized protein LOC131250688 n=1 Tax=Magnolia sinica TaxID=86752 RepID=UPI0026584E1A|nr:uncharacterized protein LOC131250688 [Magnolia sinica]